MRSLLRRARPAGVHDRLTGLLSPPAFAERAEQELARAQRTHRPLSLVVGDFDHLRELNRRHGIRGGDLALRHVAAAAQAGCRGQDTIGRIGGEEFGLLLPDTDEHGAYLLAERLRRSTRSTLERELTPGTISFGIAAYPRHAQGADALLEAADRALATAKRLGADRSVIFDAEITASLLGRGHPSAQAVEEHLSAVLVLAETLDLRDSATSEHSKTVGRYARLAAHALGLEGPRVQRIHLAGLLHDIGKIGVPDPILQKPGKLNGQEWEEMRKHPELGSRIVAAANLDDISGWVLAHHERPDGRGYPLGLEASDLGTEARILAVADSFEAMTADRVYRRALPRAEAEAELQRHAGSQFDGDVVEAFLGSLREEEQLLAT
ncbi:MAG TPA: diguanylate cyclase [Solirubrobacteraceae bacterium]|nr:diguanylate cyclase [Solirubrobacteraceae bacterium]